MSEPESPAETEKKPSVYSVIGGRSFRMTPDQARDLAEAGGEDRFVSRDEAVSVQQSNMDKALAEDAGSGWAGAGGLLSGGTFGFGPAAVIGVRDAIGDRHGSDYLRHLFSGQRSMGAYQAANVGGMLATTYATSGLLNPLEARAGALMPEATGILGQMAKGAVTGGTRAGAEGAIMGLGSAVEEAAIQNKGLTAEAALHGALMGGGLGLGLGGVVGASSGFVRGVGGKIAPFLEKSAVSAGPALERNMVRELGATDATISRMAAEDGGVSGFLSEADKMAQEEGLRLSSSPSQLRELADKNLERFTSQRISVAREFDAAKTGVGPSWSHFEREVIDNLIGDVSAQPGGLDRAAKVKSWLDRMSTSKLEEAIEAAEAPRPPVAPTISSKPGVRVEFEDVGKQFQKAGVAANDTSKVANDVTPHTYANDNHVPYMAANDNAVGAANDNFIDIENLMKPSGSQPNFLKSAKAFEGWAEGRQYVQTASKSLPSDLQSKVMHLYDAEMRTAMEAAEEADYALAGNAGRFKAAELGSRISQELSDMLDNKLSQARPIVNADDAGVVAAYAMSGHPLGGLGYGVGRVATRAAMEHISPRLAETMWRMSTGAGLSQAVGTLKGSVEKAVTAYLRARDTAVAVTVKAATQKGVRERSRKNYDRMVDEAYKFMNTPRDERFREYLKHTGNLTVAEEMTKKSDRVIQYLQQNIPPSRKDRGAAKLMRTVVPQRLDVKEHMFMNKVHIVKSPFGALSALEDGSLSKDQVQALKENWPETYNLVVNAAEAHIGKLAAQGKKLPISKISRLSILLDHPLDSIMESRFVQPVQQAMNSPQAEPPKPQPAPGPSPTVEDTVTPSEQIVSGA